MKLLPCPCGKTPTDLELNKNRTWCQVWPNCCDEWGFKFRILLCAKVSRADLMAKAIEEWNKLPRGEMK